MDYASNIWQILFAIFISGGLLVYFLRKLIDERFENNHYQQSEIREAKRQSRTEKRRLAHEIIEFCAESKGLSSFPPKNPNKAFLLSSHLETVDKEASTNFTLLFSCWGMYSLALKGMPEAQEHKDNMFKTAQESRKRLLEITSEWRK